MKNIYEIFDNGLQHIVKLDKIGFMNCFRTATDLTRVATYCEFKEGVFISEVLEGVFGQIGPLFEQYKIPDDDGKQLKIKICQNIDQLLNTYKNNDMAQLCENLVNLRFEATDFQLKCYTHWTRIKKDRHQLGDLL